MKRTVLSLLFLLAAGLVTLTSTALAQDTDQPGQLHAYYTVVPLHGATNEEALSGAAAATTVPMTGYSFIASRDGSTNTGVMIGRGPFSHGARTINIKTVLIPVVFKLKDAANTSNTLTFDPTATDSTCSPHGAPFTLVKNSPLFNAVNFTMPASGGVNVGTGQYVDEFQRANFWSNVSVTHDRFHNVLSPVTLAPTQTVTPPSTLNGLGYQPNQFLNTPCRPLGVIDAAFWDPSLERINSPGEAQTIIANLTSAGTIGPTTLPIFVFYNVVVASGNSPFEAGCCILGYHGSQGSPVQTYSVSDYETTGLFAPGEDISPLSHEVAEWMDDPLGTNFVPAWGNIGQVGGCQGNLEVGDPLSGTQFPSVSLSGMTYHPQELAFFSWFMGAPSLGVDGDFSDNGTFKGDATLCPPGGTN
jgi:hypothetical protein